MLDCFVVVWYLLSQQWIRFAFTFKLSWRIEDKSCKKMHNDSYNVFTFIDAEQQNRKIKASLSITISPKSLYIMENTNSKSAPSEDDDSYFRKYRQTRPIWMIGCSTMVQPIIGVKRTSNTMKNVLWTSDL